jgi:hypothetical protein
MSAKATARRSLIAILLFVGACFQGCFRHVAEQRQVPNVAYLSFPGVVRGATVTAEGARSYEFKVSGARSLFEVQAGRYTVTITHGGEILANRIIFVATGETKEVTR